MCRQSPTNHRTHATRRLADPTVGAWFRRQATPRARACQDSGAPRQPAGLNASSAPNVHRRRPASTATARTHARGPAVSGPCAQLSIIIPSAAAHLDSWEIRLPAATHLWVSHVFLDCSKPFFIERCTKLLKKSFLIVEIFSFPVIL